MDALDARRTRTRPLRRRGIDRVDRRRTHTPRAHAWSPTEARSHVTTAAGSLLAVAQARILARLQWLGHTTAERDCAQNAEQASQAAAKCSEESVGRRLLCSSGYLELWGCGVRA